MVSGRPAAMNAAGSNGGPAALFACWDLTPPPSPEFRVNGAVYAARAEHLRAGGPLVGSETAAIEMPRWRSVDIDEAFDLHLARLLADHPFGPRG